MMKKIALVLSLLGGVAIPVAAQSNERLNLEAEPVETVKPCPQYGEGFVYIPGTETCIKISGSIRTTVNIPVGK